MTDANRPEDTGQISVAELLARNGQQVGSGGRRRRGGKDAISVAELTGDLPVIRDDRRHARPEEAESEPEPQRAERADQPRPRETPHRPPVQSPRPIEARRGSSIDLGSDRTETRRPTAWSQAGREPQLLSGAPAANDLIGGRPQRPRPEEATEVISARRATPPAPVDARDDEPAAAVDDVEQPDAADTEQAQPERKRSAVRQWAKLAVEAVVAVIAGALLFKGFELLWDSMPIYALVLSLVVILALVALVRILRKTDDMLSVVIAIVVGVFVTMGPLAFLLSTS